MTRLPPVDESIIELALPDGDILPTDDALSVFDSKLGSRPVFFPSLSPTDALHLSAHLEEAYKCPLCAADRFLVLQMDCPREELPGTDRVCYVFGCNTRSCSQRTEGWAVLFLARQREEAQTSTESKPDPASFWDSLMTGEAKGATAEAEAEAVSAEAEAVSAAAEAEAAPTAASQLQTTRACKLPSPKTAFPGLYLHIEEELVVERKPKKLSAVEEARILAAAASGPGEEDWSGEQYEKYRARGTDKSFSRFQKRVTHYPRQCVRYALSQPETCTTATKQGPMLFYADLPDWERTLSACSQCSRPRKHFELQLMPAILSFLPVERDEHLSHIPETRRSQNPIISDGMEWGTVLVFSCGLTGCASQQHNSLTVIKGTVLVQLEENS